MLRRTVLIALTLALLSTAAAWANGSWEANNWYETVGGALIGVRTDGYNDQIPLNIQGYRGVALLLYRQTSPSWSGQTGFYGEVFDSPIPQGGSKTWSDIYLWAQNPNSPIGNVVPITCRWEHRAPVGYTAYLVLDYVPAALDYRGPMTFSWDLQNTYIVSLPTPTLGFVPDPSVDGAQLTRMHITVTTSPVPEPSALAALAFGLLPFGGAVLRRRARRG